MHHVPLHVTTMYGTVRLSAAFLLVEKTISSACLLCCSDILRAAGVFATARAAFSSYKSKLKYFDFISTLNVTMSCSFFMAELMVKCFCEF